MISNFKRAAVLTILVIVGGTAHAVKTYRRTLDQLTPDFINRSVNQPEPRAKFCALILERASIEEDLTAFVEDEAEYAATIASARAKLKAWDRLLDRTVMAYDYGDRVRPSKLIRKTRRWLEETRRDLAEFDRTFETRIIDALRGLHYNFPRLIDQRDDHARFMTSIGLAIDTIETAIGRLTAVEALAARPGWLARSRAGAQRNSVNQFLRRRGPQVVEVLEKAKHHHIDLPGERGHVIEGSEDLRPYLEAADKLRSEIERDLLQLQRRVDLIVDAATEAGRAEAERSETPQR